MACWLAVACGLFDVLAVVNASTVDLLKCDDGSTNIGDNFLFVVLLVVPVTLVTVVTSGYTAWREQKHRRHAMLLIASVLAAGAITLVVSRQLMSTGPYLPCRD